MSDEKKQRGESTQATSGPSAKGESSGLGLGRFAMTAVRASETQDASEVSRRAWRAIGWVVLSLVLVGGAVWWLREGRNIFWQAKPADEQFLVKLKEIPSAKEGVVSDFSFDGRITVKFQIPRSVLLSGNPDDPRVQAGQQKLREAINEVIASLSSYRPGEEVRVKGYRGEDMVAEGQLRLKGYRPGQNLPVWMHIEGQEMGGGEHSANE